MDPKGKQVKNSSDNRCMTRKAQRSELKKLERQNLSIADSQRVWSNMMERKQDATLNILRELASHRPISLRTPIPPPASPHLYSDAVEARIQRFKDESDDDAMNIVELESEDEEEGVQHEEGGIQADEDNMQAEPHVEVKRGRGRPRKRRGKASSSGTRGAPV